MQTKSSYRALKWTLFMGLAASLASACVVSTGDGDDNGVDIEGGDGGTNNTSGTKNTGGTKSGSSGSGGTSAGTSGTAGTSSAGTSSGGEGGGDADPDYPGVCDSSLEEPSVLNAAACEVDDNDEACGACLKMKCCEPFKACYGKEPTSACGYGPSPSDDSGQFDAILNCYTAQNDGIRTLAEILEICEPMSLNQCAATDDFTNEDTMDLVNCALNGADDEPTGTDDCRDICFPPAD